MKTYLYRYLWFTLGVVINSFGIAFITKAALGTSPISSLPYVLSFACPLSFGQTTFMVNLIFILLQIVLLRKAFHPVQFLQIAVNLLFSVCIDSSMGLLSWLTPTGPVAAAAALVAGCAILGLGISIEVAPGVVMVPGEGAVSALTAVLRKRFGSVKVAFDVTLALSACLLSLTLLHGLQGLGFGTVISALLVGRFVNFCNRYLPLIPRIAQLKHCPA